MNYKLDKETWREHIESVARGAGQGDLILVPSIKVLNEMTRRLVEFKPGVLVYVRVDGWRYFPRVGEEIEVKL